MGQRGKKKIAFLRVSERFESIETSLFSKNFCERKAQNAREGSEQDANANILRQTVTLATAIFLSYLTPSRRLLNISILMIVMIIRFGYIVVYEFAIVIGQHHGH